MASYSSRIEVTVESYVIDQADFLSEIFNQLRELSCQPLHNDPCLTLGLKIGYVEVFAPSQASFDNSINNQSISCSLISNPFDPLLEDSLSVFVVLTVIEELLEYIQVSLTIEIVGKMQDLVTLIISEIDYISEKVI